MSETDIVDAITEKLIGAQHPVRDWLWIEKDAITFTPQVLHEKFGDGRALFKLASINSRPAYWIIRGDSSWSVLDYDAPGDAVDFGEQTDEISFALEDEFGRANCGEDFHWEGDKIIDEETGEELTESDISYPVVNWGGGCSWCRMDWPDLEGVELMPHPFNQRYRILAA